MLLRGLLSRPLYIIQKTLGIAGKSKQEMSRREVASRDWTSEELSKQAEVKERSLGTLIKLGLRRWCSGSRLLRQAEGLADIHPSRVKL